MNIKLFGWTVILGAPQAETTPPSATHAPGTCPPCSGRCYQGRTCPRQATVPLSLRRETPQRDAPKH